MTQPDNAVFRGTPLRVVRLTSFDDVAADVMRYTIALPCYTFDLEDRLVRWRSRDVDAVLTVSPNDVLSLDASDEGLAAAFKNDIKRRLSQALGEALLRTFEL